jgi:hypothetical protein
MTTGTPAYRTNRLSNGIEDLRAFAGAAPGGECGFNFPNKFIQIGDEIRFPDTNDLPAFVGQRFRYELIPCYVALKFCSPELFAFCSQPRIESIDSLLADNSSVPEIPIDEYCNLFARKADVGPPRDGPVLDPISIPLREQCSSKCQLRLGVPAAD